MAIFWKHVRSSSPILQRLKQHVTGSYFLLSRKSFTTTEGHRPTIVHKRSLDILHDPWFNKVCKYIYSSFLYFVLLHLFLPFCYVFNFMLIWFLKWIHVHRLYWMNSLLIIWRSSVNFIYLSTWLEAWIHIIELIWWQTPVRLFRRFYINSLWLDSKFI